VREATGALDLIEYAGRQADDPAATLRWRRAPDGVAWASSVEVAASITLWNLNSGAQWLGDYEGLAWGRGALYAAFVDNGSGASHVAFWRQPTSAP
jgi:hypothetical protein